MSAQYERACLLLDVRLSEAPVVVACSGGADSAAALLLARAVAPRAQLVACYVDHGLRPRSSIARDIEAVRRQAKAAGAKVSITRIPVRPHRSPHSPEEAARESRYLALDTLARSAGAAVVITGHQRDDLVETSMLALIRGSGVDGIAAMQPKRLLSQDVSLVRPLLWATKQQCLELVRGCGVPFSEDETNTDTSIPRNAIRALLAQLEHTLPQSNRGIARSAALIADDRALLEGLTAKALAEAKKPGSADLTTAALRKLPVALLRRVIRLALRESGASLRNFSFEHCDAIAQAIKNGRGGRYHAGASDLVLSGGKFHIHNREKAPVPFEPMTIDLGRVPASYKTPFGSATVARVAQARSARRSALTQHLDLEALETAGLLELRAPRTGDVCIPSGRHRPTSLARFLGKAGVPLSRRGSVALLCAGGRIAAALGVRVMAPFAPRVHKSVLEVRWRPADI